MSKQLISKKELKDVSKKAQKVILDSLVDYGEMIDKINRMIDDEKTPPLVKLSALKCLLSEHQIARDNAFKGVEKPKEFNYDDLTELEIDEMINSIESGDSTSAVLEAELV